jgi:hypothetical protein
MITTTYEWRGQRILRVTVIVSLVLHVLLFLLAFWVVGVAAKIFPVPHVKPPRDKDEIVTISSATRVAKKPVPVRAVRPVQAPRPRPPEPRSVPRQELIPHPLHQPVAQLPVPSRALHELAKQAPNAQPNPPKTVHEKTITDEPSAPPRTPQPHTPPPSKRVALADQLPASVPQKSSHAARLSYEQLEQINRDLSRTIAQARSANDPLRVPQEAAAAPKRYRIQMTGGLGPMRHGEGYYFPVQSWRNGGFDYYYVKYEFTYPDGTYESGGVPWPIRFSPGEDPFTHPEIGELHKTPLPGPPAGYVPPADLGKALRGFFPAQFPNDAPVHTSS